MAAGGHPRQGMTPRASKYTSENHTVSEEGGSSHRNAEDSIDSTLLAPRREGARSATPEHRTAKQELREHLERFGNLNSETILLYTMPSSRKRTRKVRRVPALDDRSRRPGSRCSTRIAHPMAA